MDEGEGEGGTGHRVQAGGKAGGVERPQAGAEGGQDVRREGRRGVVRRQEGEGGGAGKGEGPGIFNGRLKCQVSVTVEIRVLGKEGGLHGVKEGAQVMRKEATVLQARLFVLRLHQGGGGLVEERGR